MEERIKLVHIGDSFPPCQLLVDGKPLEYASIETEYYAGKAAADITVRFEGISIEYPRPGGNPA